MADSFLSDRGIETLKRYLLGGALLGGGAATITSLINYLKHMDERKSDSSEDDSTIYVYRPVEKRAGLETGVGLAGGVAATLASYALVKKIYAALRMQKAQEELDEAQHIFIDAQGYKEAPQEKKAASDGESLGLMDAVLSGPVAVPLLVALASGIIANKTLDYYYPIPKKKPTTPKKIVTVPVPVGTQPPTEKVASAYPGEEDDARELMMRMTILHPVENSDFANLVKSAAMGGHEEFLRNAQQLGFGEALGLVKGASSHEVTPFAEHLAISWLAKSAFLKESASILAASEFAEKFPTFYKTAASLDPEIQEDLAKIAALLGNSIRAELFSGFGVKPPTTIEKDASMGDPDVEEELMEILKKLNKREGVKNNAGTEVEGFTAPEDVQSEQELEDTPSVTPGDDVASSDTSGEEAGIVDPDSPSRVTKQQQLRFVRNGKTTKGYTGKDDPDIIDKILSA